MVYVRVCVRCVCLYMISFFTRSEFHLNPLKITKAWWAQVCLTLSSMHGYLQWQKALQIVQSVVHWKTCIHVSQLSSHAVCSGISLYMQWCSCICMISHVWDHRAGFLWNYGIGSVFCIQGCILTLNISLGCFSSHGLFLTCHLNWALGSEIFLELFEPLWVYSALASQTVESYV